MAGTFSGGPAHPSMAAKNSPKVEETVDYSNLPCPLPYEEIHRELNNSLKPEHFEGMHFDFIKYISPKLSLSHSVSMGAEEIPTQHPEIIKIPTAQYVFGAIFSDPKMLLIGRLMTDGRLTAKLKCDLTDNLTLKGDAQVTSEPGMSHGMGAFDYKGRDYRAQLHLGSGALIGANYVQSVTPNLSLGGEVFWTGEQRRSGVGYSARYYTDKMVATGQVASTGVVMLGYVQNIGKGISLATDFMYNYLSKETTASVGYDHNFNQSRVRGKIDSNGCVSSFMEYLISPVLTCRFSGEVDHRKKDYKFGLGLLVGQ